MLHSIQEICEITNENRSSIYSMLNDGVLSYVVAKDGKRKVETSELMRVFPKIDMAGLDPNYATNHIADTSSSNGKQDIYELRGMINDLRSEIHDVLEDNRRLLRLLEHQTLNSTPESTKPAASEVAQHGWKNYKEMRESGVGEDKDSGFINRINRDGGVLSVIKDFFFGEQ